MMTEQTTRYRAYVLRLWQESPHGGWRVMVQAVPSGEWQTFANLERLFAYLAQQTTAGVADDNGSSPTGQPTGNETDNSSICQ